MRVAVLGFGTVGKGVFEMLNNSKVLKAGPVFVRPGKEDAPYKVSNIEDIVNNTSVDAVVECMGGVSPAFEYACLCLKAGKNFVTSNKALVAEKGLELRDLALKNNCSFLFSAACGGAIPVLFNLCTAKQTDSILSCSGIINGTTNFILSGMKEGLFKSYSEALEKAQQLGYAEADPSSDVSGMDTLRKIMLICAVAYDVLPNGNLCKEGIENIDLYKGIKTVKLIGKCGRNKDNSVFAYVEPVILSDTSVFNSVNSNYNQIVYNGKCCGPISLFGQGAGMLPTASAVLRDLTCIQNGFSQMIGAECISAKVNNNMVVNKYYVNIDGKEEEKTMSVFEMHKFAEEKRREGFKLFFAQEEQNA